MLRSVLAAAVGSFRNLLPWTGPPWATGPGAAAVALVHGVAFTAVAHCHYFVPPPGRLFWFPVELLIALLLWPAARWLVGRAWPVLAAGPWAARWLPPAVGLALAVWWQGRAFDTLWLHSRTLQPVTEVLLFLAHAVLGAGLAAGVIAGLLVTDPSSSLPPCGGGAGWGVGRFPRGSDPHPNPPPSQGEGTKPTARPPRWPVAVVFGLFLLAANTFAAWFVGRENAVYYVDFMAYWTWTADWVAAAKASPAAGWEQFRLSVQGEAYGLLPATAPAAAMAALGDHRLVYVLAVVNAYLFGVCVASYLFVRRFAPNAGWLAAAVPAVLLTMPLAWAPVLRGFLDVGGVALAILTLTVYLSRPRGELRWCHLLTLAALLVALSLFRRWYNFWVVAFVLVMGVEAGLAAGAAAVRGRWRDALFAFRPVAAVAGLFGLGLLLVAFPLVRDTARFNHAEAYFAYKSLTPFADRVWLVVDHIGLVYFLAAGLSALYLVTRPDTRRAVLVTAGMVPMIVAHFLRVQDFNAHHMYLLLPALLLLPTTALARLLGGLPRWAGGLGVLLLLAAGAAGLAPVVSEDAEPIRPYLRPLASSARYRPLTRSDLPEFTRMLRWLDDRPGERFVLVASSHDLHPSMFQAAERSLREPFPAEARRLPTSEVDRVNGFPAGVFRADLVLVADPPQTHLRPEEQQTILLPAEELLSGTGIGAAFDRLPVEFHLQNGVTVRVYRRARPIDPAAFAAFCDKLRRAHPDWPNVWTPPEALLAAPAR